MQMDMSFPKTAKNVFENNYKLHENEIIVDLFAGGGGASTGIEMALGRSPDIAVNHSEDAIGIHEANHPKTTHYSESVYKVNPNDAVPRGKTVGLLFAAPDCRSHSRAAGGAPKSESVRYLAWIVVHWIERQRPRVIIVENVSEIQKWGPLDKDNRPIKKREGEEFDQWCAAIRSHGYTLRYEIMNAADYGAPTVRKRFIMVARRDGVDISYPEPTHGPPDSLAVQCGQKLPWRTAADILNFGLPTFSIFLSQLEAKEYRVKRPLADKTMDRIARGTFRNVIQDKDPYYVEQHLGHDPQGAIVMPVTHTGKNRVYRPDTPIATITAAQRGEQALVTPFFARTAHGDVDASGKRRGKGDHSVKDPYPTVTASGDSALIGATLIQTGYGERKGQKPRVPGIKKPLGTVVAGGGKHAVIAAHLTCFNQNAIGSKPSAPLKTVVAGATRHAYVTAELEPRINRAEQVKQFLWDRKHLAEGPVEFDTINQLTIDGKIVEISDICLRMVSPPELFKAMSFPDDYEITTRADGKRITKGAQTKLAGNAVPPELIKAVVGELFPDSYQYQMAA